MKRGTWMYDYFIRKEGYSTALKWATDLHTQEDIDTVGHVLDLSDEAMMGLSSKLSERLMDALRTIRKTAEDEIENACEYDSDCDFGEAQYVSAGEKWTSTENNCNNVVCVSKPGTNYGGFKCHECLGFEGFKQCAGECDSLCKNCQLQQASHVKGYRRVLRSALPPAPPI